MSVPGNQGEKRISDDDRENAIRALGDHFTAGRLAMHEYEDRVGHATQARTANDLVPLFADLPGPHPPIAHLLSPYGPPSPQHGAPFPSYGQPFPQYGQAPAPPPYGMGQAQPPTSDKSKVAAGVLQILVPVGAGRFYTGHTGIAAAQAVLFFGGIFTCGLTSAAGALWCLIDGIAILAGDSTDAHGRPLT